MTQKWNLQDIRPAEPRRRPRVEQRPVVVSTRPSTNREVGDLEITRGSDVDTIEVKDGNKESKKKYTILATVVVLLIGAIFGLSALLSKTTLTVYPEYSEPVVNAEFIAYPDKRDGELSYEVMTIETTGEKQVKASGEEYVETKAEGFIEIMKSTAGAEQVVKNTRFRSPDGKIFRIQEGVTIPGAVKDSTGKLVPGTIRAKVVADAAGEEYNLAAGTKLDVPGFKESNLTDLYNSISATVREPLIGGYKGQKFMINDAELSTARQELELTLRNQLLDRIKNEKPAGFTSFDSSVALTYQELPTVSYGENLVTIREQAYLQLPLFKESDFAAFLASETVPTYSDLPVRIADIGTLTFSYSDQNTSATNIANLTSLTFKIVGKPTIVSEFDAEKLQSDLAGKAKTAISTVLTAHPGIKSARVESKPFWRRSFPEDAADIEIIEVVGEEK